MDVFKAFPKAIERTTWALGKFEYSTAVGNKWTQLHLIDVIVDEGDGGSENEAPGSASFTTDTILYAKPDQLPALPELIAGHAIRNVETGITYEIKGAGRGKNQETGKVEHIELKIAPTTVALA